MKTNTILAVVAAVLLILSVFTYVESVQKAERFERGQKFLSNLNPDEIAEILITKGEETTRLRRSGDEFLVAGAHGYPAKNEAVNRFIRDVLDLGLEQEVGKGEALEQELELVPGGAETTEVVFKNAADNEMVHFLVGKAFEGGSGSYVRRTDTEDGLIYLTSSQVYLSTGEDDFLKKEILDVKQADVAAIRGADYLIEDQEGELKLADLPAGKKESSKMSRARSILAGLRCDKHYLADDPEVGGLIFDTMVEVELKDQSGYQLAVASRDDKHYLRIRGFHSAGQVSIAMDADEQEAQEKSEILVRADEIGDFNNFHGSWIYEVTETTAEKVRLTRQDLIEDA
ncbi:MAG: DUF4340 domain-containing protein [bacterium]|nr:DUF4340 domain-containing protein [bacterium]